MNKSTKSAVKFGVVFFGSLMALAVLAAIPAHASEHGVNEYAQQNRLNLHFQACRPHRSANGEMMETCSAHEYLAGGKVVVYKFTCAQPKTPSEVCMQISAEVRTY